MADDATRQGDRFSIAGMGAAACFACCAPLIVAALGSVTAVGLALWIGALGALVAVVAVVVAIAVRRRGRTACAEGACATEGSCGC